MITTQSLDTESILDTFWIPAPCFRRDKLRRNNTGSSIVKSFKRHYTRFLTLADAPASSSPVPEGDLL